MRKQNNKKNTDIFNRRPNYSNLNNLTFNI